METELASTGLHLQGPTKDLFRLFISGAIVLADAGLDSKPEKLELLA